VRAHVDEPVDVDARANVLAGRSTIGASTPSKSRKIADSEGAAVTASRSASAVAATLVA
jgi:hypothetical protein